MGRSYRRRRHRNEAQEHVCAEYDEDQSKKTAGDDSCGFHMSFCLVISFTFVVYAICAKSCFDGALADAAKPVETKTGVFDDGPDPDSNFWGCYGVAPFRCSPVLSETIVVFNQNRIARPDDFEQPIQSGALSVILTFEGAHALILFAAATISLVLRI
jgi:hypothetical protein